MQVCFVRHGPAEPRGEWDGDDFERPLTTDGRQLVAEVAAAILGRGPSPDVILTSPLVRARQTAGILAECLGIPDRLAVDKRLAPGFGPEQLLKILRDNSKRSVLVLVGQEPDLTLTISKLVGRSRIALKRAGVAQVEVVDPKVLKGRLVGLLSPMICSDPPRPN
jgi:phosphohistidine phosphatase